LTGEKRVNETLPYNVLEEGDIPFPVTADVNMINMEKLGTQLKIMNEPTVAVMLPTYREAQNIEKLIREIQGLNLKLSLVIIDDSSPDGTAEIVRRLQKEYDNIILFVRPAKLGLGTAITAGFRLILA